MPSEPTQAAARREGHYRPDIDGLRAVAVCMVVGFHAGIPGFAGGFVGVDVFFAISGYLIVGLLTRELETSGRVGWAAFYARRARRLLPAQTVMLVLVLIGGWILLLPLGGQQALARSAAASATFSANIYYWKIDSTSYFAPAPGTDVLLHMWSLAVEEQFYLALPLVLLFALACARWWRIGVRTSLLLHCLVLIAGSLFLAWAGRGHGGAAFYLPVTRAYEFAAGAALVLLTWRRAAPARSGAREVAGVLGLAVAVACLVRPLPTAHYPGAWAAVPVAATLAVLWSGQSGSIVRRLLSWRPAVWVGMVSYGWYLWHWPLLALAQAANLAPLSLSWRVGLVLGGLAMAALSYYLVEGWFHATSGRKPARFAALRPRLALGLGAAAVGAVLLASLALGVSAERRQHEPYWQSVSGQLDDISVVPEDCRGHEPLAISPAACPLTPLVQGRPTVVLWGDSHARQFIPSLEAATEGREVNVVAWVASSCPPYLPPASTATAGLAPAYADQVRQCDSTNEQAVEFLRRVSRDDGGLRVILAARWQAYLGSGTPSTEERALPAAGFVAAQASIVRDRTPSLVDALGRWAVRTDVVAPVPELPRSAPLCEARHWWFSCDISADRVRTEEAPSRAWLENLMLSLPAGARLIDVGDAVCDESACRARSDGIVNYADDNHLSVTRASTLGRYFRPSIDDALGDR